MGGSAMKVENPDDLAHWLPESANQRGASIKNPLEELLAEKQTAASIEALEDVKKVP